MTVVIIYAELCSLKGFKIDLRRPFFSFKTFSTYGGVQLYTQDFQKSPSSDGVGRQRVQNVRVTMEIPQRVQPFEQLYLLPISFGYD